MKNQMNIKTITRLAFAFLMLLPLTVNAFSAGNTVTLKDIRINENGTLITISCEGTVSTKTFTMNKPARWVVDISPAVWDRTLKQSMNPSDTSYFDKVRIGQWRKTTARLVIHTKGLIPEIENNGSFILINFEKGTTPPSILPLDKPGTGSEIPDTEEEVTPLPKDTAVESSETPVTDSKVVEIPRALEVGKYESNPLQTPDSSQQVTGTNENISKTTGADNRQFEVICDGDITRIMITLADDKSFDVRNIRFPDRLIVDYPTQLNIPKKNKVHFMQKSRERLPIGIITYVSIFESQDVQGYSRLVFESDQKFTYKTSIENNALNIDIRPSKPQEKVATAKEETNLPASSTANSAETIVGTATTQETGTTESEAEKGQTFTPPDRTSFVIDKKDKETDESGHTTPESSQAFNLKSVESKSESETVSVKDMIGTLPEFAKSNILSGGKALEGEGEDEGLKTSDTMLASEPLMIEPPEEFKPLPKGTRPAADLFLTKGESVILPVNGLVRASVGDPEVLVVNVLSQEELLITAKGFGQTTLITWEEGIGRSVRWVNVGASTILKTIELERVINNPAIKVSFIGDKSVVLEGKVGSEEERKRAEQIAGGTSEKVVNLIEMLDPKRVLVKIRIVEIQDREKEDFLKQLGTGTRTESGDFQFNVLSDILNPEFPGGGIFDIKVHPSIVRGKSGDERFDPIDIALNYLEQTRKGKVLSQPNLVVLSGGKAHFRVGGEVPYTYQNENGFNVVEFKEFGIVLDVEPKVNSENNIWLHVKPSVRTVDNALAIAGIPGFRTREVETDIQVKDGQTIVIGGLLQHEITSTKSKVPLLGDMPLFGELFRSKKTSDEKTELLIFLTPLVLKDVTAVEGEMKNEADVSLSPYYQEEVVEGMKDD